MVQSPWGPGQQPGVAETEAARQDVKEFHGVDGDDEDFQQLHRPLGAFLVLPLLSFGAFLVVPLLFFGAFPRHAVEVAHRPAERVQSFRNFTRPLRQFVVLLQRRSPAGLDEVAFQAKS